MSRGSKLLVYGALAALPLTYLAQRAIISALAGGSDPLAVIEPKGIAFAPAAALTLLALVQCAALGALWGRVSLPLACAAGALLAAVSLSQSASFSTDPYSYVGYAVLPSFGAAYHPPPIALGSDFDRVYAYEGKPLIACLYGPLWLWFDRAVLHGSHSIAESLVRLRLVNLGWWALLVALFASRPETRRVAPLLAANPAIASGFVADGHVDIGGVTMLVAAAFAGTRWWLAVPLSVAAGLWKVTLAPLVLCVAPAGKTVRAIVFVVTVVALTLALSLFWGGEPYVTALRGAGAANSAGGLKGIFHLALFALTALALVAAMLGAARRWMTWLPMTMGANLFPWYGMWALPLALRIEGALEPFLIAWPLVAVTVGTFSPAFGYVVLAGLSATMWLRERSEKKMAAGTRG